MKTRLLPLWLLGTLAVAAAGCVQHVEVKPIHITVDVNVTLRQALDDYFGDLDRKAQVLQQLPSPSVATP